MKYTKYIAANYAVRAFLRQKSESIDPDGAAYNFRSICKVWDNKCAYCAKEVKLQRDHVIGMNKDEAGLDIAHNIIPVCNPCNNDKQKNNYEDTIRNKIDNEVTQERHILKIKKLMEDYRSKVSLLSQKRIKNSCKRIYNNVINVIDNEYSSACTQDENKVSHIVISNRNTMSNYIEQGNEMRKRAKQLVLDFMNSTSKCRPAGTGLEQAKIFRDCGLDWGKYENAPSTKQQYWIVALLRELEAEGKVERVKLHGPWRLK